MAHVSLRKIVLASAVAGVIALMSLGTVGCAPKRQISAKRAAAHRLKPTRTPQ